jgi:hypothetical protein
VLDQAAEPANNTPQHFIEQKDAVCYLCEQSTQTSEKELFSSTCIVHTPMQTLNTPTPLREKSDPRICAKRDMSAQLKEPYPNEPAMYTCLD